MNGERSTSGLPSIPLVLDEEAVKYLEQMNYTNQLWFSSSYEKELRLQYSVCNKHNFGNFNLTAEEVRKQPGSQYRTRPS